MKITQQLKAKIAMTQESKKQHETNVNGENNEAAKKEGAEIVKLQAELKKNFIAFRNCKDTKCPVAPKPAPPKPAPPKKCESYTRKQCRAKYEKLAETTKAKIAMNQEQKKRYETDKVPNKEAAAKVGKEIVKLQAELKKYLIAFRNCKDKRCPGDKITKPKDGLVDAYKKNLSLIINTKNPQKNLLSLLQPPSRQLSRKQQFQVVLRLYLLWRPLL